MALLRDRVHSNHRRSELQQRIAMCRSRLRRGRAGRETGFKREVEDEPEPEHRMEEKIELGQSSEADGRQSGARTLLLKG